MKLQIIEDDSQKIEGFETIFVNKQNPNLNLDNIPNNSCELIIAKGTLDNTEDPSVSLNKICSKLRSGGSVIVSGVELRCFFKNVINGITDEASASALIGKNLSLSTITSVKSGLRSLGLFVKTSTINGAFYEVTAERRQIQ
tara:strand:+ start:837 stop:1262 length:426 start_codon:yes stop_codon:yes gene_type:complete